MLTGLRIFTADKVWKKIFSELNATLVDSPDIMTLNFDELKFNTPLSCLELKRLIIDALDNTKILYKIFGKRVKLSDLQTQILVLLYKSGGTTVSDIKKYLGYSPDVATHTIDTAIYQIRKTFGTGFITNEEGVYKIGKL